MKEVDRRRLARNSVRSRRRRTSARAWRRDADAARRPPSGALDGWVEKAQVVIVNPGPRRRPRRRVWRCWWNRGRRSAAGARGARALSAPPAPRPTKIIAPRIKTALEVSARARNFAARLICAVLPGSSMKTRAAVCRAFGAPLTVETVELAEPGPGEVLIKTAACAICHSDIFYMDGAWGGELPAVYGHEASGVVEAVGAGVTRLKAGDHVVATLIRNCGFCPACAEGAPVFCEEVFPLDRQTPLADGAGKPLAHGLRTGAFAERIVVDQSQAVAIPKDMPLDSAALIACGVLTGFGAVVNTAKVKAGSSVVVIGCGGVGLNSIQGARLSGCTPIIAVDVEPGKLAAAREFGATQTINAKSEDVARPRRRADRRAEGGCGLRHRRRQGRGGTGRLADETQRRDRAGRHAALRRHGDDRSRLPRRRRPKDPRLQDGLGPPAHRRADDRRALPRGAPEARPADQRALPAGVHQRGRRLRRAPARRCAT